VSPVDFTGTWKNVELKPQQWAKVDIFLQGNTITAHFYFPCIVGSSQTVCETGYPSAPVTGNPLQLPKFIPGNGIEYNVTLLLSGSTLQVTTTVTHPTYGSYTRQEIFRK
jgi:hypothetical protein